MDSREDHANTSTRRGRSMEENTTEEHKKSGGGDDSPNSNSCAMSLGDFSMASLGEFVVWMCVCLC